MKLEGLRATVFCALFTALIIVGGFISLPIPIGPIPLVLADFFIMLAGLMLGPKLGFASTALYVLLGLIGLPVFAGGKAGLAVLMGPTGGFLIGYMLMALVIGGFMKLLQGNKTSEAPGIGAMAIALVLGNAAMFIAGIAGMMICLGIELDAAIVAGLLPFLPGNTVKMVAAAALCRSLLPKLSSMQA